ncbi:MAG: dihydroneopterin aldolase [Paracoccaceae bacterium]
MSDEVHLALGPLEDRAAAMVLSDPADRISLRDYVTEADIGAFQEERGQSQRLRFNVVVELGRREAAEDDVDRILSYDRIISAIGAELAAERVDLLETLADRICRRILLEPQTARVFLRVEKLDRVPGALGVEIVRSRATGDDAGPTTAGPAPVFLHLAQAPEALPALLARFGRGPLVVTLEMPRMPRPMADGMAKRRIALLEIEQAAWALAALDARLSVVSSRTELDWAIEKGQMVVWAPTKIIIDTPGSPFGFSGIVLALWLAEQVGASKLFVHGDIAVPAGSRVQVERI